MKSSLRNTPATEFPERFSGMRVLLARENTKSHDSKKRCYCHMSLQSQLWVFGSLQPSYVIYITHNYEEVCRYAAIKASHVQLKDAVDETQTSQTARGNQKQ